MEILTMRHHVSILPIKIPPNFIITVLIHKFRLFSSTTLRHYNLLSDTINLYSMLRQCQRFVTTKFFFPCHRNTKSNFTRSNVGQFCRCASNLAVVEYLHLLHLIYFLLFIPAECTYGNVCLQMSVPSSSYKV